MSDRIEILLLVVVIAACAGIGILVGLLVNGWLFLPWQHPVGACVALLVMAILAGLFIAWAESEE